MDVLAHYDLISFYNNFPSGLLTIVGEEGINLSGGQKQLIAFTRAILQSPDIMIIDEGTANMDRGTELFIQELLDRFRSEMGILMISHKLNIIKKLSDRIYVLEEKTLNNSGTHDELLLTDNLYRRFWKDFTCCSAL